MVFPISIKVLHAELFRIINILEKYKISTQYLSIYNLDEAPVLGTAQRECSKAAHTMLWAMIQS